MDCSALNASTHKGLQAAENEAALALTDERLGRRPIQTADVAALDLLFLKRTESATRKAL